MTTKETNDTYFNYKDYAEKKEKFSDKLKNKEYKEEFIEKTIKELKGKSEYANLFRDIFIKLQKLLNQDGILGWGGKEKGCKYINFVLNKDLTKFNSIIYNEATFQLFKDFEDKFREHKRREDHICDLYYISDDIYNNMNTLYNIYDEFTSLYPNIKSIPDCKNLSAFVFLLNDYVKVINNNKSIILKNKLNEFINEIKKHKWATNEVCENKLSHVTPLKPDPPVETKVIISPNPGSPLQSTSISSSDSQSVSDDERSLHTNGLESLKTQSPSGKELAKDTMSHNGPLLSTETQENSVTLHTTEKVQSREALQPTGLISPRTRKSTLEAEYAQQKEYIGNAFPSKRQPYPAVSVQQGVLEIPNIENDTLEEKGYLRTVTDAVSGFMKDVEPAPILGVSGGMGALFLLFKYTPVGSFFGGRRRRFRQIPSSFGGFTPGDFANIQEYGGGYVGYNPMDINPLAE